MLSACAIVVGFALDLVLGDPRWLPHPVVAMGKLISWLEPRVRAVFPATPAGQRVAGAALALAVVGVFGAGTWALLALAALLHPFVAFVLETWLCYQLLAACELRRQSMRVVAELAQNGLSAARAALSRIVGRDTDALSEQGVLKATVETVAENASDGVVAPLLYLCIGGAPLGMAYKAVNTLDSMVGYRDTRYRHFGTASARLDDAVNWLPSRLCALCMVVCARFTGSSTRGAWAMWKRDRRKHASPNAGQCEAAMAGALGVELAGPASYFGQRVDKPCIGEATRPLQREDVARANRLMLASSALALAVFVCARLCIVGVFAS